MNMLRASATALALVAALAVAVPAAAHEPMPSVEKQSSKKTVDTNGMPAMDSGASATAAPAKHAAKSKKPAAKKAATKKPQ